MKNSISNVLEIYRLVVQHNYTKDEAARQLSKKNNVAYADLLSSCTKVLNISPDKFDYFIDSQNRFNFKNFLFRRFPEQEDQIIEVEIGAITRNCSNIRKDTFQSMKNTTV